jgi:hypothetical protein
MKESYNAGYKKGQMDAYKTGLIQAALFILAVILSIMAFNYLVKKANLYRANERQSTQVRLI